MNVIDDNRRESGLKQDRVRAQFFGLVFQIFCLAANVTALVFLFILLYDVFTGGAGRFSLDFLFSYTSRHTSETGIWQPLVGTVYMMLLTGIIAIPMGVGAAIYLEEYAAESRMIRFIKLNIQNLAGVPSIIYGILGLTLFVHFLGLGHSLLAAALTMSLLILPIITIAAQEALQAVPDSFRLAGFGIGMTRWQVVRHMILPVALPGMMTGVILAVSRAIGETAPLIVVGAAAYITMAPSSLLDYFTVLPIQIYEWTSRPQQEYYETAATGIMALLIMLLMLNATAIALRVRYRRKLKYLNA